MESMSNMFKSRNASMERAFMTENAQIKWIVKKPTYQARLDSRRVIEMRSGDINARSMDKLVNLWSGITSAKRTVKVGPGDSGLLPTKTSQKGYIRL